MATPETRRFKFTRSGKSLGIAALAAVTIGGYTLYSRSTSAGALEPLQASAFNIVAQTTPDTNTALYQDGEYTGDSVRADHWGNVQVTAIIQDGKLTDFKINDYPHSRSTSVRINRVAIPYLMQEAVEAQSASIDIISGATPTSEAFIQSLQSALDQASLNVTPSATTTNSSSSL